MTSQQPPAAVPDPTASVPARSATGEVWAHERYVENLRSHPAPALAIDQVVVHVDGNTAIVSARTSRQPGSFSRYVDTYERRGDGWRCVHACVWPPQAERVTAC
jgi:ketosteroid isomerase-like protein